MGRPRQGERERVAQRLVLRQTTGSEAAALGDLMGRVEERGEAFLREHSALVTAREQIPPTTGIAGSGGPT